MCEDISQTFNVVNFKFLKDQLTEHTGKGKFNIAGNSRNFFLFSTMANRVGIILEVCGRTAVP
jgi:hypothetical protein